MIKDKYLPVPNFIGKYPEFQERLYGLWIRELELGYLIFYVEQDNINFIYQPKSYDEQLLLCQGKYVLGCHENNDKKFNIHINDASNIHNFQLSLYNTSIIIQFIHIENNSNLNKIIACYDKRYLIGEDIELSKI